MQHALAHLFTVVQMLLMFVFIRYYHRNDKCCIAVVVVHTEP